MLVLILFAFLAGIVTILSPCILPVLPIVLSGSLAQGRRRPVGIVTGFVLSFTFFTLFLTALVSRLGLSADFLRGFSVLVILLFGTSLLFPQLQVVLEKLFTRLSNLMPTRVGQPGGQDDGFMGGVLLGISLGLLWTPCVGPILASVISLALSGSVTGDALFITLAYALGTGLPMLAIAYGGRQLLTTRPRLMNNLKRIQQGFGVVMILTAAAIYFQLDRQFQVWVLNAFPNYGTGLTQFENVAIVKDRLQRLQNGVTGDPQGQPLFEMQEGKVYPKAPELEGGTAWINSTPLRFEDNLKGKVVLVDFWTYSCINCIRTFPYLIDWYEKYQDQGFVIVGVHSPEFEFEKNQDNVMAAMEDYGLTYPVVMDNDFRIWRAYNNRYWPAHYLIDREGRVRYTHFGEGKYLEVENKIRELLGEDRLTDGNVVEPTTNRRQTPETYLGYARAQAYTLENQLQRDQIANYSFTTALPQDAVGIRGSWQVGEEAITAQQNGVSLSLNFLAELVHLVMAPAGAEGYVTVLLDGQPLPQKYWTADMDDQGRILVNSARKYDLVDLGEDYGRHTLELVFDHQLAVYAFTFGS
ncbi:MAG TPA: cytochrome c biogenesis protein DipZ [Patescibacteria group bacterium]|jgi:cytochrome c biogenesis protein CcdA/thiol-disulfide isomerase/thioredoxin